MEEKNDRREGKKGGDGDGPSPLAPQVPPSQGSGARGGGDPFPATRSSFPKLDLAELRGKERGDKARGISKEELTGSHDGSKEEAGVKGDADCPGWVGRKMRILR